MPKWIALCLLPLLASCATCRQENDREKLLFENDMLQAKLIIVANDRERLPLAQALLERAARDDRSGEAASIRRSCSPAATARPATANASPACSNAPPGGATRWPMRCSTRSTPNPTCCHVPTFPGPNPTGRPTPTCRWRAAATLPSSGPGRWSTGCSRRPPERCGPRTPSPKSSFLSIVDSATIRYSIEFPSAILCPSRYRSRKPP